MAATLPEGIPQELREECRRIERRVKRGTLLWFALVTALLVGSSVFSLVRLRQTVVYYTDRRVADVRNSFKLKLAITDEIYRDYAEAGVRVFAQDLKDLGPASLGPAKVRVDRQWFPDLRFGNSTLAERQAVVRRVASKMESSATIFVFENGRFLRLFTTMNRRNGDSAVGTELKHNGETYRALLAGRSFTGFRETLEQASIASYRPIRNDRGQIIGAISIGFALKTLDSIQTALENTRILKGGFLVVDDGDGDGRSLLQPSYVPPNFAKKLLATPISLVGKPELRLGDYKVVKSVFKAWDQAVYTVLHTPDVDQLALALSVGVMWLTVLIVIAVLVLSWFFSQRLTNALIDGELARRRAEFQEDEARIARHEAEQANDAKSAFLANMSHELRTPMNAIIGYTDLLLEEASSLKPEEFVPDLQKIQSSAKHLLGLINDVLDLSKVEAGKMDLYIEPFDILPTIQDVVATLRPLIEARRNRLVIDCSLETGFLQTDLTKFRQCLVNLVGNAAKFTEDGVITIRVQERLVEAQEWIDLQVSDTGVGMSPQQMDRLFESFSQGDSTTTRQYGGTGLGLAISRRFSRLLGGDISVTSTQGEGSTFTLSLPRQLSDPSADHSGPPTLSNDDRLGPQGSGLSPHGTVLVIDDDPAILDLASRHLERQGYQVAVAFNAEQGLSLARQLLPDLILLDLLMPGLNGMACLDQLENNPSLHAIPVIVVTAMDLSAKELRALQRRVRAVVRKSGEGHDLAEQINAILTST